MLMDSVDTSKVAPTIAASAIVIEITSKISIMVKPLLLCGDFFEPPNMSVLFRISIHCTNLFVICELFEKA